MTENENLAKYKGLTGKQMVILPTLNKFFRESKNIKIFLDVINGNVKLSLRLIDWFVTNYSKKNNTMFNPKKYDNKGKKVVDNFSDFIRVHQNYKAQLSSYNKRDFDPFQRRDRIKFRYGEGEKDYISTTIGQLNFFKWAISNHILDYINEHLEEIENDMNQNISVAKAKPKQKQNKNTKSGKRVSTGKKTLKQRKKRQELSQSATKNIIRHNHPVSISFN